MCALRERLTREARIENLEVVDPATPGYAQRAADLLNRDGFVVVSSTHPTPPPYEFLGAELGSLQVKDVLDAERLAKIRRGCEIAVREMVGRDPDRS